MTDITIVITCRNYENYLREALLSAYTQSKRCPVLIYHDHCGQDNPVGLSTMRNRFLQDPKSLDSEYVIFLDADDTLPQNYAEELWKEAEKQRGAVVTCRAKFFGDQEGQNVPQLPVTIKSLLEGNSIHASALIPVAVLREAGGYDTALSAWEDWDLWLRLCQKGIVFLYAPDVALNYRRHAGSMNRTFLGTFEETQKKFREKYEG